MARRRRGGAYGSGTVFKITAGGVLTTLHDFCALSKCTDGSIPTVVLLATDGNIYGATREGGATNIGSLFKLSTTGQFETIYSFCTQPACADGGGPFSLMQATDGNFYGTTQQAGGPNSGTIFEITPQRRIYRAAYVLQFRKLHGRQTAIHDGAVSAHQRDALRRDRARGECYQ